MEIVVEKGVVVDLLADLVWELEKVKGMLGRSRYPSHFRCSCYVMWLGPFNRRSGMRSLCGIMISPSQTLCMVCLGELDECLIRSKACS
jgi:hypothetical protein